MEQHIYRDMNKVDLLYESVTLWLVSVVVVFEVVPTFPPSPGPLGWIIWAVSLSVCYLVPVHFVWRLATDYFDINL